MRDYLLFFDRIIPVVSDDSDHVKRHISTVGYCIRTPTNILILTYEIEYYAMIAWSGTAIRTLRGRLNIDLTDSYNIKWDEVEKKISQYYNIYCNIVAQSHVKSVMK